MNFVKNFFKDLNIYDLIINSIYSIFLTILFFNVFVQNPGYHSLNDFFTGQTIYENYNKKYDLAFFFAYIIIYFLFLIPYKALKIRIFESGNISLKMKILTGLIALYCFGEIFFNHQIFVDPHHQAEHLNTFFMHSKFNMEYYKDIMLVHGLRDIVPGWLGHYVFGSDSLLSFYLGSALFYNLLVVGYILLSFVVFTNGLFFIIPLTGLCIHDNLYVLLGIYILSFLSLLKLKKHLSFLSLYIIMSFVCASFWTTMGFLWVIAAMPAAFYSFACILKSRDRFKKLFVLLLIFLLCFALCFKSMSYFIQQACFYAQSSLYAFGTAMPKMTYDFLGFFVKLFALISVPVFGILLCNELHKEEKCKKFIFALSFSLVFVIFSLNYTLGRIDNDSFIRMSYLSNTFIFILLPYFVYLNFKKISQELVKYVIFICVTALIFFSFGRCLELLRAYLFIPHMPSQILDIRNDEKAALNDITTFIKQNSEENSVFLDLTNKGLLYYLLDKKMPVPYVSYYNIVNTKQSKNLKEIKPDVIFINDSSGRIDEIYPSLRVNSLYRNLLLSENYKLIKGKNDLALLKKERHIFTDEEKQDLDRFLAASDIKYLPDSWGASVGTLPLKPVDINFMLQKAELPDSTVFNIHFKTPLKGTDFDLIYIDIDSNKNQSDYIMKINHSPSILFFKSRTNKMLIPFDNFPSWLLEKNVTDISVKTNLKTEKTPEIKFYKRGN